MVVGQCRFVLFLFLSISNRSPLHKRIFVASTLDLFHQAPMTMKMVMIPTMLIHHHKNVASFDQVTSCPYLAAIEEMAWLRFVVGQCQCGWVHGGGSVLVWVGSSFASVSLFVFNINGRVVLVLDVVVGLWWVTIGEERFGGLACGGRERDREEEREIDEE